MQLDDTTYMYVCLCILKGQGSYVIPIIREALHDLLSATHFSGVHSGSTLK